MNVNIQKSHQGKKCFPQNGSSNTDQFTNQGWSSEVTVFKNMEGGGDVKKVSSPSTGLRYS